MEGRTSRHEYMKALAARLSDEIVVTNLANTATEWYATRPSDANLYAVGMGMVTPYGLGLALALPSRGVVALDGDGGIFFDLSVFGTIASTAPRNLCVIVFDNGGYVSTGALPTVSSFSYRGVRIADVARALGVRDAVTVSDPEALAAALEAPRSGPLVIVAETSVAQAFVGPLPMDLKENKYRFIRHIETSEGIRILRPSAKEHGAKPAPDPEGGELGLGSSFGQALYEGLRENGVNFAIGLPCSGFTAAQKLLMDDPTFAYVPVAHEGTGLGICAGAWLGGKRAAALIENFGLFAGVYQLLRGHMSFGIPTLILAEFRGDTGDQEFFAEGGEVTLDVLAAMRINHRVMAELGAVKPAIRDALRWMDGTCRPFALVPTYDFTRLKA